MIIKVCGMREAENICAIERLGIHWMGFIFYPPSPRYIEKLPDYLPVSARRVGVFVNESIENIVYRIIEFGLNAIQLHGKETPDFCKELLRTIHTTGKEIILIKAFSIAKKMDLIYTAPYEAYCQYFLFDTPCQSYGGSGETFNWKILSEYHGNIPFLLSGGIGHNHIRALQEFKHPLWAGIDLNSCFEIRPAYKDPSLLQKFIQKINGEV